MDDIAACIKDHQYNEAIRQTVVDPEEAIAKAILDRVPKPRKGYPESLNQMLEKLTIQDMMGSSLGRYFLCECVRLIEPPGKYEEKILVKVQDALDLHHDYFHAENQTKTDADHVLSKFTRLSKKLSVPSETIGSITKSVSEADFLGSDSEILKNLFKDFTSYLREKFFQAGFEKFKQHQTFPATYQNFVWYRDREVTMENFVVFRDLGRGAFGVVSGARHRVTGQMVALKGMNRKLIKGKKALKLVKAEFSILKALGDKPSPFCVSLVYSFMDATDLYLGLPLCTGGDLMFHLRSNPKGYGLERAKFFAAEIILAIEHLHSLGILYRDLKPENVLVDDKGHTKISDMGLAVLTGVTPKTIGDQLFTGRAGTPGYWPPEMIKKEGYGFDADYWSYAVVLYEFLTGVCTFSESHTKCKDRNEATCEWEITFPTKVADGPFPPEAKDLILKLLDRERSTRLGACPDAVEQIKNHPFFSDIKWDQVATGKSKAPWVPPSDSINAASQEEIQERSKDHEFKRLKLTEEDNVPDIAYSSRFHERDLVTVLRLDRDGKLGHLESTGSSACVIL